MRKILSTTLLTLALAVGVVQAGDLVRVDYQCPVEDISGPATQAGIAVGDLVSGFFVYNTTVSDGDPDVTAGRYSGTMVDAGLTAGVYAGSFDPGGFLNYTNFFDDFTPNGVTPIRDEVDMVAPISSNVESGLRIVYQTLYLYDSSTTAFSNDAIQVDYELDDFDGAVGTSTDLNRLHLTFADNSDTTVATASCRFTASSTLAASVLGLTVNSTADAGDALPGDGVCETAAGNHTCTLRAAIQEANALAGTDTIDFNISGAGPHTIQLGAFYPAITDSVVIDGTTQPGFAGSPVIELDGSNVGLANGLTIDAGGSIVRGLVINRFERSGILLRSTGNTVQGNFIGTDVTGTVALGNGSGVAIQDSGNLIGGTGNGERNLISGNNTVAGVVIGGNVSGNVVQGNYIGTDVAGMAALGNLVGIRVDVGAFDNRIGGTDPGAGNIIAGNYGDGIAIGSGAAGNLVEGNYIGTGADGASALGNGGDGVDINSSSGNIIGGTATGARNVIAFNNVHGVRVVSGTGNSILANSIFANAQQGIDLSPSGVTANDTGDGDTGANELQNFPVLISAADASVAGTLNSSANTQFDIEFFANSACDPLGFGEGQTFLGSTLVITDGSGNASFTAVLAGSVPSGQYVTATATDPAGNTSEFSQCVASTSVPLDHIYWTDTGTDRIQRAGLDGSGVETLVDMDYTDPRFIALDVANGKMYWTDSAQSKIRRANLDGTGVVELVSSASMGIALDLGAGKMYWGQGSRIQRANLDGSGSEDLVTGLNNVWGVAIDVTAGKVYWADFDAGKVQCANLDGTMLEDVVPGLGRPVGVALEAAAGKIYWTDYDGKIQRANTDGTGVEDLVLDVQHPQGIALDVAAGKMYWTDGGTDKIQRANMEIPAGEDASNRSDVLDLVTAGLSNPLGIVLGPGAGSLPVANAGPDQTVDENALVTLDGSASMGTELTFTWSQLAGPVVTPDVTDPAHPAFTAPFVNTNQTLTFQLIVNNGSHDSEPDTVDITVVNVNNAPVADAGDDSTIKEGAIATLDGSNSFDPEGDTLSFSWAQTGGPEVMLTPDNTVVQPQFVAPYPGAGDHLVFELVVSDGLESSSADAVSVMVVVNSPPVADAGPDVTKDEGTPVTLDGTGSNDPDGGDSLSYQWTQTGGTPVVLSDDTLPAPSFEAPAVGPGGAELLFELVVTDNDPINSLSSLPDEVKVTVRNINDPPSCNLAVGSQDSLWPPNHKMVQVAINGVMDEDSVYNTITLEVTGITQDEPVSGLGDGDTSPDGAILKVDPADAVVVRAERSGTGNGRVYRVSFTASDGFESCDGAVEIAVPHGRKDIAADDGQTFDSTMP